MPWDSIIHFLIASPGGITTTEEGDDAFYEIHDLAEAGEVNLVWRDTEYGDVLTAELVDATDEQLANRAAHYGGGRADAD